MKIVIAVLYPIISNRIGGMDRFFWEFNDQAIKFDLELTWIFPISDDYMHYCENGITPIFLPKDEFEKHLTNWLEKSKDVDILITHFISYNTKYIRFWKSKIKKLVCVDHMSRPLINRSFRYRIKYLTKGLLNYFYIDTVIAVSPFVKRCILRELGLWWFFKTFSIYNGVDNKYYKFDSTIKQERFIFSIGHLIADKGFQDLILAISILKNWGLDCKVKIAGDGPLLIDLKNLVLKLGLVSNIEFIGNITNQSYYYNSAICTVVPSKWKEACGFTVLEALSCGSYVVGSNVGAIPEILIEGTGKIFDSSDFRNLAEVLKEILWKTPFNNEQRSVIQEYAFNKFSLTKMVQQHLYLSCRF